MKRIPLLLVTLVSLLISACQSSRVPDGKQLAATSESLAVSISGPTITGSETYDVTQMLTIINHGPGMPEKHNLWVALIRDVPPYQEVHNTQMKPDSYQLITDEYGNQYAEFDLGTTGSDPDSAKETTIEISYTVSVNRLTYDLDPCVGALPNVFNQPELHIESNNAQIMSLSSQLSTGQPTACRQVRAFYDHIGSTLTYSYNGANWGAQAALGEMGSDCTEYSSLLIALSRAAGIPARYVEGLLYMEEGEANVARTEHAWAEVFLPEIGWTPVDPTLGRSSVGREQYFATHLPDHIIVTTGRNPSTLRGASYWSHLFWPGDSADIEVRDSGWRIEPRP